jgi:spore coat protein U-like protein
MKLLRIAFLSAAAAALLSAADAAAQSPATATFSVSATVAKNCVIDGATDIAISDATTPWDPTSNANPTATGTITVRCTRGTTYTIDLNGGVYTDALTHTNGTDKLPFKLYASDCSTDFTPVVVLATSRAAKNTTICAGIDTTDATLNPIAGDYAKDVTVDVTF